MIPRRRRFRPSDDIRCHITFSRFHHLSTITRFFFDAVRRRGFALFAVIRCGRCVIFRADFWPTSHVNPSAACHFV